MPPSRLRLGPSQSRPLTDASPGSARPPGLRGLPGSALAPPEYPYTPSLSNRTPVLSSLSGQEVNDYRTETDSRGCHQNVVRVQPSIVILIVRIEVLGAQSVQIAAARSEIR